MKARHYILMALTALITFVNGLLIGRSHQAPADTVSEKEVTTVDTIPYYAPMLKTEKATGTYSYTLPVYRFYGAGFGGQPRQRGNDSITCEDTTIMSDHYGTGAGGEPRCSSDSATVELPMVHRHYADSTYEAWVSGPIAPRLDSVRVFSPKTIISRQKWKPPKRWHIGISAGYGYGPEGFAPYVGVGITYSILSF